jgi:uncharacterized damage-inducible protein DinB
MKHSLLSIIFIFIFFLEVQSQNSATDALVKDYERAKQLTLAYIDAMPGDKYSFKPTEEIRTFSEQMLHLAQGTIGLSRNGTGAEKIFPDENLEKTEAYQSKEEVKRIVSESFDYAIDGIRNMNPENFDDIVEAGPFQVTKLGWVNKAYEHLTHHRGQCAIYLRLNGITPPQFQLF